jgi:hypothetical protein
MSKAKLIELALKLTKANEDQKKVIFLQFSQLS